jgi:hypothetical protein
VSSTVKQRSVCETLPTGTQLTYQDLRSEGIEHLAGLLNTMQG